MNKHIPLPPDPDLPPDLQQAVKNAIAATDALCPPPSYDAAYWREEREAIARLVVWQAAQGYQERDGVSLKTHDIEAFRQAMEWNLPLARVAKRDSQSS